MTRPFLFYCMRPLARWTIGPVSEIGHEMLRESVRLFSRIYPEFDRIICYNHVDAPDLKVDTRLQTEASVPCILKEPDDSVEEATGCGWKLAPPRIRPDSHELWIDNDLVIRRRLPSIDEWISSDKTLISAGTGRKRMYGEYDDLIPDVHLCAGLFGLPPGFDFHSKIEATVRGPLGGYGEQGLTTAIVTSVPYIVAPLSEVWISEDHVPFPEKLPPAIHFAGGNRKNWHRGWVSYNKHKIPLY